MRPYPNLDRDDDIGLTMVDRRLGVVDVFVDDKGCPLGILVFVPQSNLKDGPIFSKYCVQLLRCDGKW
jgi:hypothetical protein